MKDSTGKSKPPQTILIKMPRKTQNRNAPARLEVPAKATSSGSRQNTNTPTVRKLRRLMDVNGSEYKAFFQNLYDGVIITDLKGRLIDANRKACRMCMCSPEDLQNKKITDVITGITEDVLESASEALKAGRHVLVDTECLRGDGGSFSCEVAITHMQISGVKQVCFFMRDITEREETKRRLLAQEQELSMSEEQLRESLFMLRKRERELSRERDVLQSLMDTIPDRIFFRDEHGRFLRINKAMTEFLGLEDPDEVEGKTDFDFFDEKQARVFLDDDRKVMTEGKPILDKLQEINCGDGPVQYSSVSKVPMRNHEGRVIGLVGISRDITDRVQTERELKKANKKLERMERLEATALFVGQIAHDFNNLLVPLLVYPEMIKKNLNMDSPAYKDLDIIENTAQQIADLNQDLMALSRRGKTREQMMDLHAVVPDVLRSMRRCVTEKHIEIKWEPASGQPRIKFDRTQLARVLHNLFQNAVDAMDGNGRLVVNTENVRLEEPIGKFVQVNAGEYVKLSISDNGIGISESIQDRIFDPFFTTKSSGTHRGGSGLGLSIVYSIMSDYDSYIDMESEEGQGTTFFLYFPLCRNEPSGD